MYHIFNTKNPAANLKEIASHYNVIMMADAVTTVTLLSGVLYYLDHNLQARGRLQDELRNTFPSMKTIDSKGLLNCVYLNAVIEEGLRIYPSAGAAHLSRIVPKGGCEISGSFIPEGVCFLPSSFSPSPLRLRFSFPPPPLLQPQRISQTTPTLTLQNSRQTRVSVHPWSVLRDPTNFHAPSEFIPERWIPSTPEGQKGDKLERSLPFSYGPRGCLGRK